MTTYPYTRDPATGAGIPSYPPLHPCPDCDAFPFTYPDELQAHRAEDCPGTRTRARTRVHPPGLDCDCDPTPDREPCWWEGWTRADVLDALSTARAWTAWGFRRLLVVAFIYGAVRSVVA